MNIEEFKKLHKRAIGYYIKLSELDIFQPDDKVLVNRVNLNCKAAKFCMLGEKNKEKLAILHDAKQRLNEGVCKFFTGKIRYAPPKFFVEMSVKDIKTLFDGEDLKSPTSLRRLSDQFNKVEMSSTENNQQP